MTDDSANLIPLLDIGALLWFVTCWASYVVYTKRRNLKKKHGLFAAVRRKPGAMDWICAIWRNGRPLLATAALLYLVLLAVTLMTSARSLLSVVNEALILSVFLHLAIIAYLRRSPLVRGVFAEFPLDGTPNPG